MSAIVAPAPSAAAAPVPLLPPPGRHRVPFVPPPRFSRSQPPTDARLHATATTEATAPRRSTRVHLRESAHKALAAAEAAKPYGERARARVYTFTWSEYGLACEGFCKRYRLLVSTPSEKLANYMQRNMLEYAPDARVGDIVRLVCDRRETLFVVEGSLRYFPLWPIGSSDAPHFVHRANIPEDVCARLIALGVDPVTFYTRIAPDLQVGVPPSAISK